MVRRNSTVAGRGLSAAPSEPAECALTGDCRGDLNSDLQHLADIINDTTGTYSKAAKIAAYTTDK
jgi:hypothetical protein